MVKEEKGSDRASVSTLNWLRAAVLGANDGIVSISSIVFGVAGATNNRGVIFTAGMAGLVAGALSMAVGEYVSVSSQRDAERAFITREKTRLKSDPGHELKGLTEIYEAKGLTQKTAHQVAVELTKHDPIKAHLDAELNIDEEDLVNPWQAAFASLFAFTLGGLIPFLAIIVANANVRIPVTFVAVLIALTATGYISATVGGASRKRAIIRVVVGGALAMVITYVIGSIFGTVIS